MPKATTENEIREVKRPGTEMDAWGVYKAGLFGPGKLQPTAAPAPETSPAALPAECNAGHVVAWPLPFEQQLEVHYEGAVGIRAVQLLDEQGRVVFEQAAPQTFDVPTQHMVLNTQALLAAKVYYIKVITTLGENVVKRMTR